MAISQIQCYLLGVSIKRRYICIYICIRGYIRVRLLGETAISC